MFLSTPPWRDLVQDVLLSHRGKVMNVADVLSAVRRRLEQAYYAPTAVELDTCVRVELEALEESGFVVPESEERWFLSGAAWQETA